MRIPYLFVALVCLSLAGLFGQAMMGGPAAAASTPANSMLSPTRPATGNAMMAATADPVVGNQLRYAMSTGHKVLFTTLAAAQALAAQGPTLLFFAADWCPYCQADLRDINANGSRLGTATVVVLDYDKVVDLKTRYGITAQDTFVQIDAKGNKLAVWNGGGVDGILSHLLSTM